MLDTLRADPMIIILSVGIVAILGVFYWAHKKSGLDFNAFDLVMDDGKVSKTAVAFMLVLAVSTWVIVDLQITGKLTEGLFGLWLGAWVVPLVAKVVFKKSEMPGAAVIAQNPLP